MKLERLGWIVAILIVGGLTFYFARDNGYTAGLAAAQQNSSSFFQGRGGGNGGNGTPGTGNGGGNRGGGFQGGQGVAGQVTAINGNTITLTMRDGTTATVQVTDQTHIRKQDDGTISDIHVKDQLVATGPRNGDSIQADMIQLGGFGNFGRGGNGGGTPT